MANSHQDSDANSQEVAHPLDSFNDVTEGVLEDMLEHVQRFALVCLENRDATD